MVTAVYPVAAGQPILSGSYIPTLFSSKMLVEFYESTVFGEISNTDYEGEIKQQGDTVEIRTLPDITINDHAKGQTLTYEAPEPSVVELLIDKGKSWSFRVDLVDLAQSDIKYVNKWAQHAGMTLKTAIDAVILQDIYGDAHADNIGATAGAASGTIDLGTTGAAESVTKSNILDYIVDCGVVLDEQNVPQEGRWIVLPNWACGLIKKSDLKDASITGDGQSILRNGRIGMIDRFTIYASNQLATYASDSATYSLFGQKEALTFASQVVTVEQMKNPNAFGDILRGLHVYGYKVVKPEALGVLYMAKG
jgi:hypothetical protein